MKTAFAEGEKRTGAGFYIQLKYWMHKALAMPILNKAHKKIYFASMFPNFHQKYW